METSASIVTGRFVVPEVVVTHFHIREGDVVGDFGAGSGYFTPVLSKLVGPSGKVYACEIQKELVEKIGSLARTQGLSNVNPLWCDLEELGGSKVPDEALNVALIVNTFFQLEDKKTSIEEIARTLKSGGKLFVIDWSESFGGLGPQPNDVVTEAAARAYFEAAGFIFERSFDAGGHHYGLAYRKP